MRTLLVYKGGVGDALFVGTIAKAYLAKHPGSVYTYTFHPEVFDDPDIKVIDRLGLFFFRRLAIVFPKKFRFIDLYYTAHYLETPHSTKHILELMAEKAGIPIDAPVPKLAFPIVKETIFPKDDGRIYVGIQSTGSSPMLENKFYYPDRFEVAIEELKKQRPELCFVQLGLSTDPLLNGVEYDLRGKTSIRGVLSVLADLDLFVGLVGFLMHGARAVDTPAVIVYGGREKAVQSGYTLNTNIESSIDCSPCWAFNCPIDRACMKEIEPQTLVKAVLEKIDVLRSANHDEPSVPAT